MSKEKIHALFIGGPAAGRVVEVPAGAKVWYERQLQHDLFQDPNARRIPDEELNFQYIRFEAVIENGELHYFRPANWTEHEVVKHLVTGYSRGAQEAQEKTG